MGEEPPLKRAGVVRRGLPGLPPLPTSDREASELYQVSYASYPYKKAANVEILF